MQTTSTACARSSGPGRKGGARAVRRAGRVPGVVYGDKQTPVLISLDPKELGRALGLHREGFFATLFDRRRRRQATGCCPATCSSTR